MENSTESRTDVEKAADVEAPKPNDDDSETVAQHYNNRESGDVRSRRNSPIFHLRNFNNWIKSMVIQQGTELAGSGRRPLGALDLCCGKGGDLLKWRVAAVSRLVCVDIAAGSVTDCEKKWKTLRPSAAAASCRASFVVADVANVRLKNLIPRDPLDLVSCQFALHYSFGSAPRALRMLRNVSEVLRPGGIFVGTLPDADHVVTRIKNNSGAFGNDVYRVEPLFDWKEGFPLFGAKYDFRLEGVVDCPEYLVYFPLLVELAKKFDLELLFKTNFRDFYEEKKKEGKDLMFKMETFETFRQRDQNLSEEKYGHVLEYFKENKSADTIGTMSQQEWEVASMYCVFAFQKRE